MATATACTFLDALARTTRTTENTAADWDTGMNWANCNPGVGIAVGPTNLTGTPEKWTLLDQAGAARAPQDGQSIGGVALNAGVDTAAATGFSIVQAADDTGSGGQTALGVATLTTLAGGWVSV